MRVISHRGAMGYGDENSLRTIKIASDLPVEYIEFDIQTTKNGIIVLYHNLATPKGNKVKDTPYKNLQREVSYMPTLREALRECGKKPAIIESKAKGTVAKAIDIINKSPNSAIASFIDEEVLSARINLPRHKTFLLQRVKPFGIIKKAKSIDASGIGINKNWLLLLPYYYIRAKRNNLEIYTYSVDNYLLAKIISFSLKDIFIVTKYPKKMLKINDEN